MVVRGLQDQEQVLVVVLDLRALVGVRRVLDRQLVKAEELLQCFMSPGLGLVDSDPDELATRRIRLSSAARSGVSASSCWRTPSL